MMKQRALPVFCFCVGLLALGGCQREKEGPVYRVIGEAYAGPNELPIRQDLSLRSPQVGTVKHGERLEVLDRKRRYVQVRTTDKKVGWADMRLLISGKQKEQIEAMAAEYKDAPSMGLASVFDVLNVHTAPNRYSPTFLQIGEKEKVEIVGHQVVERKPYAGDTLELEEPDAAKPPPVRKKRPRKEPAIVPPPPPAAPGLPSNWMELSRTPKVEEPPPPAPVPEDPKAKKKKKAEAQPGTAVPMDDLTLIRTKNGSVGWVLSNALFLEVPDEVAQYAEGKRITAYFVVGTVESEDGEKNHWLWTTQSQKYAPFEFDGFRLFTYNARRKRYETAYRENDLRGYFPVRVKETGGRYEFRIVSEGEGGKLRERTYAFDGARVKLLTTADYQPPTKAVVSARTGAVAKPEAGLLERVKNLLP
jgi:hypothetical protein